MHYSYQVSRSWSWVLVTSVSMGILHACLTLMSLAASASAEPIVSLPGQPNNVSFRQFSGYIAIDDRKSRSLFYYFVEAKESPNKKPLVLWLNGGPGCSSVGYGAFKEHGPFQPKGDKLIGNPYSWNTVANMLYLESPAGVGFSYSYNKAYYFYVNDSITAQDNLKFLERWFLKFPQYKNRDLFLTGESYAGHYVPQLAELIVSRSPNFKRNLKGMAIGNPLLDFETDFNSAAAFFWSHGLMSDPTYLLLNLVCNFSRYQRESFNPPVSRECSKVRKTVFREIGDQIDADDVILDVCLSDGGSRSQVLAYYQARPRSQNLSFLHHPRFSAQKEASVSNELDVCIDRAVDKYLNRRDAQKALHAQLIGVGQWDSCSDVLSYDSKNVEIPMTGILGKLLNAGIPTMLYSGDQDSIIPFIGTRINVAKIATNLGLKTTVGYRNWFHEKQVAGWTQVYGDILTFATIRGAAHEAPFTHPERSLGLFSAFLNGMPLPNK